MLAARFGIVALAFALLPPALLGAQDDGTAARSASWARLRADERPRVRALVLAVDDPRAADPSVEEAAGVALALVDEGLAASAIADPGSAIHWLDRARAWGEFCDAGTRATISDWRGQVLANTGRSDEARKELGEALDWFRGAGDRAALARCLRHAAWLEYRSGAPDRCEALLSEQLALLDDDAARAAAGDVPLLEERRENAFVSALLALDARDPARTRREIARLFAADRRVLDILPASALLEVDERRVVVRGELISRLLDWSADEQLADDAFALASSVIEGERARVLRRVLEALAPPPAESPDDPPPLADGVAELCWFGVPRKDGAHLVLLARRGDERSFTDLGLRGPIDARVEAFAAATLSPENTGASAVEFARASHAIAREVLGPALAYFAGSAEAAPRRVVVSPEGGLGKLPFCALVARPLEAGERATFADLPYLARTSAFVVVPSRAILRSIAAPCPDDSVLFLSTPQLWYSKQEGEEVARIHGRIRFLDDHDASAAGLVAALRSGRFGWVHLGCHAEADPTLANRSRLVLGERRGDAEPDRLSAADVARLPLTRGARVVLSACGTATGDFHRGEGVLGVWRAFLVAGASAVVATLHDVDDRSAAATTVRIHAAAAAGAPLAEAVRAAQLDWLAGITRPPFPRGSTIVDACHPSLWAAWVCVGNDGGSF